VLSAGIADQDRPLLDAVAWSSIRSRPVDSMLVVEAPACRVEFNQLITHCGRGRAGIIVVLGADTGSREGSLIAGGGVDVMMLERGGVSKLLAYGGPLVLC